jgi:hypothetical protein
MVREGVTWFSATGVPTGDVALGVTSGFAATYSTTATTSSIATGTQTTLPITTTNTGTRPWPAAGAQPVRLSYHWIAADGSVSVWNGARTALPADVAPGAAVTLQLQVAPPPSLGTYILRVDLVQEGVSWFSAQGVLPKDIPFVVTSGFLATYTPGTLPSLLPGGRATLPLTVRNDGAATWPSGGATPVHLAAHVFDTAGATVLWDGARTNLTADTPRGTVVTTGVVVDAPVGAGAYRARPDLVQEGVAWFSALGVAAPDVPFVVLADYRAELPVGPLAVSRANPVTTLSIKNSSAAMWSANAVAPVLVSMHWLDAQGAVVAWDGPRTKLAKDVAPGETVSLAVGLGAVPPGATQVVIDLLSEGLRWFGAGQARPVTLTP